MPQTIAFTKGQAETTAYRGNHSGSVDWLGDGFWQGMNGYARFARNSFLPGTSISAFKDRVIIDLGADGTPAEAYEVLGRLHAAVNMLPPATRPAADEK